MATNTDSSVQAQVRRDGMREQAAEHRVRLRGLIRSRVKGVRRPNGNGDDDGDVVDCGDGDEASAAAASAPTNASLGPRDKTLQMVTLAHCVRQLQLQQESQGLALQEALLRLAARVDALQEGAGAAMATAPAQQQQQQQPAAAAAAAPQSAAADRLKRIMDSIPVAKDALAAYPVKWEHYTPAVQSKIRAWVGKKVAEMLGAEEPDFADFIMGLLADKGGPGKVEAEAREVLDDEAAPFVAKLFRVVIYETERTALQL